MELQFFRHAFFKLRLDNTNIVIDPFINSSNDENNPMPLVKCPVSEKSIGKTDIVLLSQEHFDHFDKKTVEYLCNSFQSTVVAHDSILSQLEIQKNQKKAIGSWDKFKLFEVNFEVVPAHYPKAFYPVSYLLKDEKSSVFFAADTTLTDHFNGVKADVALLPIGGADTMDVVDAVKATKTIKPKYSIPMHYDTFDSIKADPNEFKTRIEKSILKTIPVILKYGEKFHC